MPHLGMLAKALATRQELVNGLAAEYAKGTKGQMGALLDYLCPSTGWSSKYGAAAVKVMDRTWTLSEEPCGKYLVSIMAEDLERLERFDELGLVAGLLTGGASWQSGAGSFDQM